MRKMMCWTLALSLILSVFCILPAYAGKPVVWCGAKQAKGLWLWAESSNHQTVPQPVKDKLKTGYTVYWVECREPTCNSAKTAFRNYYKQHNTCPDWRNQKR